VRASQAQARAITMHPSLEEEKGRRRVVENEFRNSRLTCGELEQRLIRAEQEIVRQYPSSLARGCGVTPSCHAMRAWRGSAEPGRCDKRRWLNGVETG